VIFRLLCYRTLLPGQSSRKLRISPLHHLLEVLQNFHGSCARCIPLRQVILYGKSKFDLWILSDEDSEFPTSKSSQLSETASSASEDSHAEPDGTFASQFSRY
jgi:hypothetical protein